MLFISYRENDLFNEYVPQIIQDIPIAGQFIIPANEEITEIVKRDYNLQWCNALNRGVKRVITDGTCYACSMKIPAGHYLYLDQLFSSQVEQWLEGNTVQQNLLWFAEQVVVGREIKNIIIVEEAINDHWLVGNGNNYPTVEEIADAVKKLFINAKIIIRNELMDAAIDFHNPENILIMDRHCGVKELMIDVCYTSLKSWPYNAALYLLPFETCAAQLIDRGELLFEYCFDTKKMRDVVEAGLDELPLLR